MNLSLPLEMTGGNHTVPPVIPPPAKHKNLFRRKGKYLVCESPARTFHQLEFCYAECLCVCINHTHPGRRDDPGPDKFPP